MERSILSAMIREEAFRRRSMAEGLSSEQFWTLRPVFEAVIEMARKSVAIDVATLSAWLDARGQLDSVKSGEMVGNAAVDDIARHEATTENWSQWVRELRRSHATRIASEGGGWISEATDPEIALEASKAVAEAIKKAMAGPPRSKTGMEAMRILVDWMNETRKAGTMPGIDTGMPELNAITGGIRDGQLWTVLAETSGGKSVLMQQYAVEAITAQKRTAIFSIEMQTHEVAARLLSRHGKIELGKFMEPAKTKRREFEVMEALMMTFGPLPFTIDDTPAMTLSHVEAECRRICDESGKLGLVVVDYLQIVKAERKKGESREEAVAGVSGGLKQLAKAMGCPVLTGSQMNREGKARESDAVVFDSDVTLMIGRDGIMVTKNRNGPRNIVLPYELVGEFQSFVPFDPEGRAEARAAADAAADAEEKRRKGGRGKGNWDSKQYKD